MSPGEGFGQLEAKNQFLSDAELVSFRIISVWNCFYSQSAAGDSTSGARCAAALLAAVRFIARLGLCVWPSLGALEADSVLIPPCFFFVTPSSFVPFRF